MRDSDLARHLAEAFAEAAIPGVPEIEPSLRFDAIEGLDSVSRVRLMMCVEEQFNIEISTRENSKIKTIGDLMTLVRSKTEGL